VACKDKKKMLVVYADQSRVFVLQTNQQTISKIGHAQKTVYVIRAKIGYIVFHLSRRKQY